jgi:hypothetical protein
MHLSLRQSAPPNRISSPPRRNNHNADDTPTQPHFLRWARSLFFQTRNGRNEERLPAVVHVPLAQGTQVSPPVSIADVRLYICHSEELLSDRSTEETQERERGSEEGNGETESEER